MPPCLNSGDMREMSGPAFYTLYEQHTEAIHSDAHAADQEIPAQNSFGKFSCPALYGMRLRCTTCFISSLFISHFSSCLAGVLPVATLAGVTATVDGMWLAKHVRSIHAVYTLLAARRGSVLSLAALACSSTSRACACTRAAGAVQPALGRPSAGRHCAAPRACECRVR